MHIGAIAASVGVEPHVLRHWDDVGVLMPPRDAGGRRVYDAEHVARAQLIRLCQRAGLSLEEIARLLAADRAERADLARGRLAELRAQQASLALAERFIAHTLECRHPLASECPDCRAFTAAAANPGAEPPGRRVGPAASARRRTRTGPRPR